MNRLRVEHGVYGTPGGRINVAGLPSPMIERTAAAIAVSWLSPALVRSPR